MAWDQTSRAERFAIRFAIFGMAITAVFFAYLELSDPCNRSETLEWALSILCPPSVLSLFLVDVFLDQHTAMGFFGWFIIGLLNSGLYAIIGMIVGRYLWKAGQSATT